MCVWVGPDSLRLMNAELQKAKILQSGFIAQEVEIAAQKSGYDFSGLDLPGNSMDHYGLRYAEFTIPLVKAVQELSAENQALKEKIIELEKLKSEMAEIKKYLDLKP